MPSPNPPSELPAVQAEVPPCPGAWTSWVYYKETGRWINYGIALTEEAARSAKSGLRDDPIRVVYIPGEQAPSAPTKFPTCAVHSFVTTDVCGCARRDAHPKPTGMTREVEELVAMCEKMADDPLRMVDQISLREKIAAVRAAGGGA